VTVELVKELLEEELPKVKTGKVKEAAALFMDLTARKEYPDFLTLSAYEHID
jgi:hypothetical protein